MNMRLIFPRLMWTVLLLAAWLNGCASTASNRDAGTNEEREGLSSIADISVKEATGKIVVAISADAISSYATYRLDNPPRLVVDLRGVTPGKYVNPVTVNKGAVTTIQSTLSQGDKTRLEIGLVKEVEFNVQKQKDGLLIEVNNPVVVSGKTDAKPQGQSTEKDQISEVISAKEKIAKENSLNVKVTAPPATTLNEVKVTADVSGSRVLLKGNGSMASDVFLLEGEQLVVDIPAVSNMVSPNSFTVDDPLIRRVRIGQFTEPGKKVRVALELKAKVSYQLDRQGDQIFLNLTKDTASKEEKPRKSASSEKNSEKNQEKSEAVSGGFVGKRISLDLQEAELKNVLRLIAEVSGHNLVLSPDVKGSVTVKMLNVPWDQALDLILKINNLGQVREDNIIRVMTTTALANEEKLAVAKKEASIKAEDTFSRILPVNYAKAKDLVDPLKKSLSARGEITVDERTNTLIIKDVSKNLDDVQTLVKTLDRQTPQVMIEARIVEANTDFSRELGIQWGTDFNRTSGDTRWRIGAAGTKATSTATTSTPLTNGIGVMGTGMAVNLPAAVGLGSGGALGIGLTKLTAGGSTISLDLNLSAMESAGKGKVISSPKVLALDNKEATIKQGTSIPYETSSASGPVTQWIDAVLELTVTPHVSPDNSIIMKIKASKNAPGAVLSAGGQPSIEKNETVTEILLKDGETAVIGGIYTITKSDSESGVPFLSKVPILGWLFKKEKVIDKKTELLIFLQPKIIVPAL